MFSKITLKSLIFSLFIAFSAQAQPKSKPSGALAPEAIDKIKAIEDTLGVLAYAVVNDSLERIRFAACQNLIPALVRALKVENSFRYPFERLKSISILTPPDSSFRIFTWQLFVNDSTYRYYGAIQMNQSKLQLFPLRDHSDGMEVAPVREQLSADRWYGALYYNLRQFDTREGRKYLLFGYDAFAFFEKRKVLDVLSFDNTGKPIFGAPVFERPQAVAGPPEQRMVLEYAADASVRLNWDEQYQIVLFDHLVSSPSPYGRGMMSVPDGSYDGFKLEKGRWKLIEKVFNDSQKEAPTPEPILSTRKGKDIVGKPKGN
jgi:hypothetical protein